MPDPSVSPLQPYEPDTRPHKPHTVTVDLDTDTYFVLTEALSEFAAQQRHQADFDAGSAESRNEWAATADRLREEIEQAL